MARARDPNRDRAFEIWKEHSGDIDLVKIAEQLGVSSGTVRGWKSKDKWDTKKNGTLRSKERNAPKHAKRSAGKKEQSVQADDVDSSDTNKTDKYILFAREYFRDYNATRAAMVVGYKKTIAYNAGYRLLKKDEVQAELKRLIDSRSQEINIDVRRIVDEYLKIAFADISDLLVFKGDLLTLKSSTEVDTSVISEVRQNRSGVSIKLHDKTKALEKLERYVNYMTEEERLKIDKMRAEIAILNGGGDGKEEGDDGFIDALKGTVSEAWNDDEPKEDNDG